MPKGVAGDDIQADEAVAHEIVDALVLDTLVDIQICLNSMSVTRNGLTPKRLSGFHVVGDELVAFSILRTNDDAGNSVEHQAFVFAFPNLFTFVVEERWLPITEREKLWLGIGQISVLRELCKFLILEVRFCYFLEGFRVEQFVVVFIAHEHERGLISDKESI